MGYLLLAKQRMLRKKRKAAVKRREQEKAEYETQVQHLEDFLSSSDVIDHTAKNLTACFKAYGPPPVETM